MTEIATRPLPPDDSGEWEVVPETYLEWDTRPEVVAAVAARQGCRYSAGWARKAHGAPIVAVLYRGRHRRAFGYCAEHLYGRWIEDGVVVGWRYRP